MNELETALSSIAALPAPVKRLAPLRISPGIHPRRYTETLGPRDELATFLRQNRRRLELVKLGRSHYENRTWMTNVYVAMCPEGILRGDGTTARVLVWGVTPF